MLFWADLGWVRRFSVQPLIHPEDLKKMKVFVWSGNTEQMEMMKDWGTHPVALEPSDILPGLSTGMINEVSATPFSANAGQYATVAKHMLAINWAPLVGGLVMRKQAWDRLPTEFRHDLLTIAGQTGRDAKAEGRRESEEAVEAMKKKQHLKVHLPSANEGGVSDHGAMRNS
jgi:TRAP-type C4-dicarboxylate transport system substrate-binding protein